MTEKQFETHWRILQSVSSGLPRWDGLERERADAEAAQSRGYYLPDEDDRLRLVYLRYLRSRAILWEIIRDLKPHLKEGDPRLFALAFSAASILVRSAHHLVLITRGRPVVHQKLDEAEPRFGIPRKTFTRSFKGLGNPVNLWRYHQACEYYERNRTRIHEDLQESGPPRLLAILEEEFALLSTHGRPRWSALLSYRIYSTVRRSRSGYRQTMFQLFRLGGEAVAGRRQPFLRSPASGKRVTREVREEIETTLRPGDILVTRHDDALSNLFLPGFWPHAALFVGTPGMRRKAGLPDQGPAENPVLEAKKDGVKIRPLAETLSVDSFVVLRPKLNETELREVIDRALTHEGKLYDFLFDFRQAERLACTEVIYRSFHGTGPCHFQLVEKGGRLTLPAEELIRQSLKRQFVELVAIFGVRPGPPVYGPKAAEILHTTLPSHE